MMTKDALHGFVPAVVTPFDEAGAIQREAFATLIEHLIAIGATGICVAGDNGESWALSAAERGALVADAVAAARGRVPVFAGCSAPTIDAAIGYARAGADNGASALLMMPPTYVLKGSADEIVRRYAKVAAAVGLPIIVYNSPRRAGYSLGLDVLDRIMAAAPVIGIKESDRDFFRHTHLIAGFADRLAVMVGPSHYIMPGLALGAAGFIATGPELLGEQAGRLVELARAPWGEEQRRVHLALTIIYEALMGTGTWPAAFKAALGLVGLPAGVPRDPVLPLAVDDAARLADRLRAAGVPLA